MSFSSLFQFVILVIDSTDRERLSITKEELYKMLATEVSIQTSSSIKPNRMSGSSVSSETT